MEEGPQNAAALYNLGVACETLGDPAGARSMYTQVAAQQDDEEFQQALARVERTSQALGAPALLPGVSPSHESTAVPAAAPTSSAAIEPGPSRLVSHWRPTMLPPVAPVD